MKVTRINIKIMPCVEGDRSDCQPEATDVMYGSKLFTVIVYTLSSVRILTDGAKRRLHLGLKCSKDAIKYQLTLSSIVASQSGLANKVLTMFMLPCSHAHIRTVEPSCDKKWKNQSF